MLTDNRYDKMLYRKCAGSGLQLPLISLGLWHNFGSDKSYDHCSKMILTAFNAGITHFDIANNYGPYPGSAEENFANVFKNDLKLHRNELIVSTKGGYKIWDGPYGAGGTRKHLHASLELSLKRLKLDYVDIFYHHVPDPETPIEETMLALSEMVKQGKVLYVGISKYSPDQTTLAVKILKELNTPCLVHQTRYNMLDRLVEKNNTLTTIKENKVGCTVFSPLAQGILSKRYLNGVPEDSRVAANTPFLSNTDIKMEVLEVIQKLKYLAMHRNQSMAQMALAWILRNPVVTSVILGASKPEQILDCVKVTENLDFLDSELATIDKILESIT